MKRLVVVLACVVTVFMAFHSYVASFYSEQEWLNDADSGETAITYSPGQTFIVSVDSSGIQGNRGSIWPSISADGRYVAFLSSASNLVSGDTN